MADPGSTRRLGLDAAPEGLSIAQDVLNTAPIAGSGVSDLLGDVASARCSMDAAVALWAEQTGSDTPVVTLGESDLEPLRELRDELRRWLLDPTAGLGRTATLAVALRRDGAIYTPDGIGADQITGLVTTELVIASRTGRLRRLKTCANHACRAAFYDGSPGATRTWHDVKTCGNTANLRASRARRRTRSA
ncbi:CGNR zinc finger protein [Actinomycetospora succinea]|uniref:CGNR zinc finger protein n=1 Tax=Actinomycetospora succinea TaxID=663603 RepID=A0A4V3DA89_9PSEU|nr:CGNR zinc finger domain-containing protein [Actinomycetospora succinea]TDQ60958.1 CGNR zinc finger protein [Actinomycetospora succinea]